MGRRGRDCYCSTCNCSGTPITADGTVTWFTHSVSSGVITRVDHEGLCKTYWVDSVSGGGAEAGTGTEADPFTNLNTVFNSPTAYDECIYSICTHSAAPDSCPKVKVLVKGTIDYAIVGNSGRNYGRNLIIEPWGDGPIEVSVSGSSPYSAIASCIGCVWKNTNSTKTASENTFGFNGCSSSTFDNCTGTGTGGLGGVGFYGCSSSTFDNCTGTGGVSIWGSSTASGFSGCSSSTFKSCAGIGTDSGGNWTSYGFDGCSSSTFDNCTGTGGSSTGGMYGAGSGYGFNGCSSSTFDNCTGSGYGGYSGGYYGYCIGFSACFTSTFHNCNGYGYIVHSPVVVACGFYGNTSSSYSDCTGTPNGAPCDI